MDPQGSRQPLVHDQPPRPQPDHVGDHVPGHVPGHVGDDDRDLARSHRTAGAARPARSAAAGWPGARVLLVALGTHGDVEPAVRLGTALAARGARVVVAVLADGEDRVRRAGLTPLVLGPPSGRALWWSSPAARELALRQPGLFYVQQRSRLARLAAPVADALVPALRQRPDLVVCGLATAELVPLLATAGLATRLLLHAPLLPAPGGTSAWGGPGWGALPAPAEAARQQLMWALSRGMSSALALAVRPRLPAAGTGPSLALPNAPAAPPPLLTTSPVLDPDPAPGCVQTGWWADPAPVEPLPATVDGWLERHPGAVLLSLGTTDRHDPEQHVGRLAAAAAHAGVPAVVQVAGAAPRAQDVLVLPHADHRVLLPRLAAAVHHGGSGTTHAATAAGLPQLVVPLLGDQPHYARRVEETGLGTTRRHTAAGPRPLGSALAALLADPGPARTARAAATRMAAEDGLGAAVEQLSRQLASREDPR